MKISSLASRMKTKCWTLFADHEPHHSENLVRAKEIVCAHLADSGLTVLPGVYHHEQDGRAACGLWRFDRESKRLISAQSSERN